MSSSKNFTGFIAFLAVAFATSSACSCPNCQYFDLNHHGYIYYSLKVPCREDFDLNSFYVDVFDGKVDVYVCLANNPDIHYRDLGADDLKTCYEFNSTVGLVDSQGSISPWAVVECKSKHGCKGNARASFSCETPSPALPSCSTHCQYASDPVNCVCGGGCSGQFQACTCGEVPGFDSMSGLLEGGATPMTLQGVGHRNTTALNTTKLVGSKHSCRQHCAEYCGGSYDVPCLIECACGGACAGHNQVCKCGGSESMFGDQRQRKLDSSGNGEKRRRGRKDGVRSVSLKRAGEGEDGNKDQSDGS